MTKHLPHLKIRRAKVIVDEGGVRTNEVRVHAEQMSTFLRGNRWAVNASQKQATIFSH